MLSLFEVEIKKCLTKRSSKVLRTGRIKDMLPLAKRYEFMKTSILLFSILLSGFVQAECNFEENIPQSWLQTLKDEQVSSHMKQHNETSCRVLNEYFVSIGKPENDCSKIPDRVTPIMRIKKEGDLIAYFQSPKKCYKDHSQPIYAGYALIRKEKQIAFELRVGTHNKALKRDK